MARAAVEYRVGVGAGDYRRGMREGREFDQFVGTARA